MRIREYKIIFAFVFAFAWVLIFAPVSFAQDAGEILSAVDKNLTPESYEAYRKIINEEPDGSKKEFVFYTVKKNRDKVAMLYLSPASEKGRSTLRLGDNMWLYIPKVGRPIRITSMQSVTGGIFNNSDIMRLDYSDEYEPTITGQNDEEYLLDLKAKSNAVPYDNLKMRVMKNDFIVTQVECFSKSGMLIKTLDFKEIKDFGGGIVRPAVIETHSPLQKGYRSIMIYAEIKLREFPDEVFTQNFMAKFEDLRK